MATTKDTTADVQTQDEMRGRLVLLTGTVVPVPAEGVAVSTEHYDDENKMTVPVVGRFVIAPDDTAA